MRLGGRRTDEPTRVADATEEERNAAFRILVFDEVGKVIQRWDAKGWWEGTLPQKYTAMRSDKGWSWDDTDGSTIQVNTDMDGHGGKPIEEWAGAAGKKLVVYVYDIDDVTFDKDAKKSDGCGSFRARSTETISIT